MFRSWATSRRLLALAAVELVSAAVFIVASVYLLGIGSRGCIVTLVLAGVTVLAGGLALYGARILQRGERPETDG